MVRVVLPHHLRTLARVSNEVELDLNGSASVQSILDALEKKYPTLRGTIRDHVTQKRRPLVRFFACGEDISHAEIWLRGNRHSTQYDGAVVIPGSL